jgi:hypothetical protein
MHELSVCAGTHLLKPRVTWKALMAACALVLSAGTVEAVKFEVLHSFEGGEHVRRADRELSVGLDGALYGIGEQYTTGEPNANQWIWKYSERGYEEVEFFKWGDNKRGYNPTGHLVVDESGRIFGIASFGGPIFQGVAFTVLPGYPREYFYLNVGSSGIKNGLWRDEATGIFYGGVYLGIYQIDAAFTTLTFLDRIGRSDPLAFGFENGELYGTFEGGNMFSRQSDGTLRKTRTEKGCAPMGATPDGLGNYWGVSCRGGEVLRPNYARGQIYRIDKDGHYKVMYRFDRDRGGSNPSSELVLRKDGKLYGTTRWGSKHKFTGTVYQIDPVSLAYKTIHEFKPDHSEGQYPRGLVQDKWGNLYGTTYQGGAHGFGVIYRISD